MVDLPEGNVHKLRTAGNGATPIAPDTDDIEALFLDPELDDGITAATYHTVPIGKPRDFFRVHPDKAYRRRTEIYVHKPEGVIDAQTYIIAGPMRGRIEEARPCTLVTAVYRDG